MTTEDVLKEGVAACAVLEQVVSRLKCQPQVVVSETDSDLLGLVQECRELAASGQNDYDTAKRAVEICIDVLDIINADYKEMTAGLHEKLENYK